MRAILESDFRDCYDHWFIDSIRPMRRKTDNIFQRNSFGGMSRSEMFTWFKERNILTPRFGKVKDLLLELPEGTPLVIYLNESSHQGEGKILVYPNENDIKEFNHHFASEFIQPRDFPISIRLLFIGQHIFWLSYQSSDKWRSNCGDNVDIQILNPIEHYYLDLSSSIMKERNSFPLLAIDFVEETSSGNLLAIDLNVSPQIKGTGIEFILKPKEIAEEIDSFLFD